MGLIEDYSRELFDSYWEGNDSWCTLSLRNEDMDARKTEIFFLKAIYKR